MKCKDCKHLHIIEFEVKDGSMINLQTMTKDVYESVTVRIPYCPKVMCAVDLAVERECGYAEKVE